jgi:hypothetical protein
MAIFAQAAHGITSVEGEIDVVDEAWSPVGRREVRIDLRRKGEFRVRAEAVCTGGCPAAVELPVEEREDDDVPEPYRRRRA